MPKNLYGLIGKKLSHSFSQAYFRDKFKRENISDSDYLLFETEHPKTIFSLKKEYPSLRGLNVTIPHKETVIPFLDKLSPEVERIGAVNVIRFEQDGTLSGHNSDYEGFKLSLEEFLGNEVTNIKALVFGTGGASKAVDAVLEDLHINFLRVSRYEKRADLTYEKLHPALVQEYRLLINTTPLGMFPNTGTAPNLPYEELTNRHFAFDLVYNPAETLFMKKAAKCGASVLNGYKMLVLQAESAYRIWQNV